MNKGSFLIFFLLLLLAGCKDGALTSSSEGNDDAENGQDSIELAGDSLHLFEETVIPETVDELFDDFFFSFAVDAKFQNQRISFPVACKDGNAEMKISRQDWSQYNRFGQQAFYSVIYEREHDLELQKDTAVSDVSVEWMYLDDDYVEKFNFSRQGGKWMLKNIQKDSFSNSPNGSFLKFYASFVSDSVFQRNALTTPLRLVMMSEDVDEGEQVEELSADEWFEMKHDLPFQKDALVNIDYGQSCISENRKTLLMQGVSNGLFIKFKFDKSGGEWKLMEVEL